MNSMSQTLTQVEIRRLQKMSDYSIGLCIPKNLSRILDMHEGDLVRFNVNHNKQLVVEKFP